MVKKLTVALIACIAVSAFAGNAPVIWFGDKAKVIPSGGLLGNVVGNVTGNVSGNVTGNLIGNITGNVTGNASTASAFDHTPSACGANTFATSIAASGNLSCSLVGDSGLSTPYLKADGTRGLSGDWNAGAHSITATTFVGALSGNATTSTTAGNVSGTVAIGNGGTGQTTQQTAMDALAGTQQSGKYLRSDGTHTTLSSIQVADVPTLNQNTSGTASNVTGVVASANGGTGVNNGGTLTYGASNIALTTSGATALTLPTAGTVATLAGNEALSNKTLSAPVVNGILPNIVAKTANYTAADADNTILCNAVAGAFTVTLPTAVGGVRKVFTIIKTDSSTNVCTIATTSSQTINGATTFNLYEQYSGITVQADGANWAILSRSNPLGNVAQAEVVVSARRASSDQAIATVNPTQVVFNTEDLDVYGEYDNTTGLFTAKRAGQYTISGALAYSSYTADEQGYLKIYKNGSLSNCYTVNNVAGTTLGISLGDCSLTLAIGDTLAVYADSVADASYNIDSSGTSFVTIKRFPSQSELAVKPDQTPGSYSGSLVGTGWNTGSSGYGEFAAGSSITLTQTTAQNITCTAAGSSLPGITCTLPRLGNYEVCASGSLQHSTTLDTGSIRLVDGGAIVINGGVTQSIGAGYNATFSLCGQHAATTLSETFKLQGSTAGGTFSILNGNPVTWTIKALDQGMAAPLFAGSVTTIGAGNWHMESMRWQDNGSCVLLDNSGPFSVTSRSGTGDCVFGIAAGTFSRAPVCSCEDASGTGDRRCQETVGTATSKEFFTRTVGASPAPVQTISEVLCFGPR